MQRNMANIYRKYERLNIFRQYSAMSVYEYHLC
jgi:hypothetical protein